MFDPEFIEKYKNDSLFEAITQAIQAGEDPYKILQHCVVSHTDLLTSLKSVVQKTGVSTIIVVESMEDVKLDLVAALPVDSLETLAELFELVVKTGEGVQDNFHFVDCTMHDSRWESEVSWRVYYKNRYCIEIDQVPVVSEEEIGGRSTVDGYGYEYRSQANPSFIPITAKDMIKLIKSELYEQ